MSPDQDGSAWKSIGYVNNVESVKIDNGPAYEFGKDWDIMPGYKSYQPKQLRDDQCPHCERDWHKGALTQRVANMWQSHEWDEDYDPDADTSQVVCVGSDHEGPALPRKSSPSWILTSPSPYQAPPPKSPVESALEYLQDTYAQIMGIMDLPTLNVKTCLPGDPPKPPETIEFGGIKYVINEWIYSNNGTQLNLQPYDDYAKECTLPDEVKEEIKKKFGKDLPSVTDQFPVPESPGYDFTPYVIDDGNNKKYINKKFKKGKP